MAERLVLDAYALVALLSDDVGAEKVAAMLEDAGNDFFISTVNLGEVWYILQRKRGKAAAGQAVEAIFQQPRLTVMEATWERIRQAAVLKGGGGISYADAFAAALALEMEAALVTGDQEFRRLERQEGLKVVWLD